MFTFQSYKEKLCWHKGRSCPPPPNMTTTSCFLRPSLTNLYLATQLWTSPAPWQSLVGPFSFAPTGLFLYSSWGENSKMAVSLTARASVNCRGGHFTFFFSFFLSSSWSTFNNPPVPVRPIYLYHSFQDQSFPVGLRFKPALAPSPMWSSGWVLLGCWQISAECWSEGIPAPESGPVHRAWPGRGPRAGRCWPAGAQAAWGFAAGPTDREQDPTTEHCTQQRGCTGWTGEAVAEVEWRKKEGGTGSPCAQLEK